MNQIDELDARGDLYLVGQRGPVSSGPELIGEILSLVIMAFSPFCHFHHFLLFVKKRFFILIIFRGF